MTYHKCDKCGKTFNILEDTWWYSFYVRESYQTFPTIKDPNFKTDLKLDLCSDCMKQFENWLKEEVE